MSTKYKPHNDHNRFGLVKNTHICYHTTGDFFSNFQITESHRDFSVRGYQNELTHPKKSPL